MHSRYVLMVCLSLLLQTSPGDRGDASAARADSSVPATMLPAPSFRKIIAHGVDFEADTATIRSEALPVLSAAAQLLGSDCPVVIVVAPLISDHYSDAYRELLARRRAKAMRRYLVDQGIGVDRIAFPENAEPTGGVSDLEARRNQEERAIEMTRAAGADATADTFPCRPWELRVP